MAQKTFFLVFVSILLFNFCSLQQKSKTEPVEQLEREEASGKNIETARVGEVFQTGIASWYGVEFQGRRTSNGEIYDMYKLTAAHKTLPFNTLVEVESLDNGKRIIVRINDRGPFVKDRIIDLSYRAAKKIRSHVDGVIPVSLRIVKPGTYIETETVKKIEKEEITETEEPFTSEKYYLQAGAFSDKNNADKMLRNIKIILSDIPFKIHFQDGLYKVISSPLPSRTRAEEVKEILLDIDIDAFIKEK